jgi:hypothetical protein
MEQVSRQTIDNLTSAICALIEALGMQAENKQREHRGQSLAYTEESFRNLIHDHNLTGY